MNRAVRYILMLRRQLTIEGTVMRLDEYSVLDIIPHYWREEAPTITEWFQRMCRGLGVDCVYDVVNRSFTLRNQ